MSAIDNIIKRIEEDAEWKIKEYYDRADKEIEKIRKYEEAKWKREKEKIEMDGKRDAETIKQMHISQAHLDGKKMLMNARERVINRTIENIMEEFRDYVNYDAYLEASLSDAKDVLGDNFDIICLKNDKELLEDLSKKLGIAGEITEGDIEYGGFVAVSKDSLKRVDYTIKAYVDRNISSIRKKIYLMLFGEEYA